MHKKLFGVLGSPAEARPGCGAARPAATTSPCGGADLQPRPQRPLAAMMSRCSLALCFEPTSDSFNQAKQFSSSLSLKQSIQVVGDGYSSLCFWFQKAAITFVHADECALGLHLIRFQEVYVTSNFIWGGTGRALHLGSQERDRLQVHTCRAPPKL